MAFDSGRGVVALYGGQGDEGPLGDVWEWNGSSWTAPPVVGGPEANAGSGAAYDSAAGGVLVLAGNSESQAWYLSAFAGDDCNQNGVADGCDIAAGEPDGNGDGVPDSCQVMCGSADFNCDGDFGTDADIEAFFACLAGTCPGGSCPSSADFNADGDVGTDADIEAFFRVLAGGAC
jgi:hypothetical protein